MRTHVGIDVGGTFTDICVANADGAISVYKTPTTPDVATGVLDGLAIAAAAESLELSDFLAGVERFGHGSTVAVNALLQRKGVRTGLITTRGFADTLWIARMMAMTTGMPPERITHYRRRQRPDPLVDRALVAEVAERIDYRGDVVVPMSEHGARAAIQSLLDRNIEALAICTLWSFRNPTHERRLRDLAREMAPGLYVCASSDLVPVLKEYERTATTVINAYLGPVVHTYIGALREKLAAAGLKRDFFMLNSVGGVIPPDEASVKSVQLLGSGPSGGALASQTLARQLGEPNVLIADMGGTSFDAGLIVEGEFLIQTETSVGNINLLNPMIGIKSIGTGGGSIAMGADGMLKVGPESAGSVPGPACYGRGGTRPTVSDANLVLGYLDPDAFLGGRMRLDRAAAEAAILTHVAEPLGMTLLDAAAGIRVVADQHMADLLRQTTLERGYDPRDFCLFAYGGAGPVHASAFGREAGVRAIVIPAGAPVFSAQGILAADMRLARQRSVLQRSAGNRADRAAGFDIPALATIFAELEAELRSAFAQYGVDGIETELRRSVAMRYARQVHEVPVPIIGTLNAASLVETFDRIYEHRYGSGTGSRAAVIEITNCQLQLIGKLPKFVLRVGDRPGGLTVARTRRVYIGHWVEAAVYDWPSLPLGAEFTGPALVDAPGTTVWVGPGDRARVDELGNLRLEILA